jgi:hypothetical protein
VNWPVRSSRKVDQMARETTDRDPTPDSANIRSPEERYGGEGHAGTDPFAGEPPTGAPDKQPDRSLEVPDANVEDLIERPPSAAERAQDDSGSPAVPKPQQS